MENNVITVTDNNADCLERIMELLQRDTVYIPKDVMSTEDIYEETKLMFGIIFTDCLNNAEEIETHTSNKTYTVEYVKNLMHKKVKAVPASYIQDECLCSLSKANVVKQELIELMKNVDLSKCFVEKGA